MSIKKHSFGKTTQGEEATLYTLINKKGMSVSLTDYGANIVNIIVPDKDGKYDDVVLGYDKVSGYENNGPGYGSFIGRYANRISGASLNSMERPIRWRRMMAATVFTVVQKAIINLYMRQKSLKKRMRILLNSPD